MTVPLIHAGPPYWAPHLGTTDLALRFAWTQFAVPTFMLLSGRLYSSPEPLPASAIGHRLLRLLVPYLTVCGLLSVTGIVAHTSVAAMLTDVALGNTYGVYYYVVVLATCIVASWMLSRLPRAALLATLAVAIAASVAMDVAWPHWPSGFWRARDPIRGFWLGYFLIGWLGWEGRGIPLSALAIVASAVGVLTLAVGVPEPLYLRAPSALAVAAMLWRTPVRPSSMLVFLSDVSLAIYLLHAPLQAAIAPRLGDVAPVLRIAMLWLGGLGGAVGLTLAVRWMVGRPRARWWLGA